MFPTHSFSTPSPTNTVFTLYTCYCYLSARIHLFTRCGIPMESSNSTTFYKRMMLLAWNAVSGTAHRREFVRGVFWRIKINCETFFRLLYSFHVVCFFEKSILHLRAVFTFDQLFLKLFLLDFAKGFWIFSTFGTFSLFATLKLIKLIFTIQKNFFQIQKFFESSVMKIFNSNNTHQTLNKMMR